MREDCLFLSAAPVMFWGGGGQDPRRSSVADKTLDPAFGTIDRLFSLALSVVELHLSTNYL